jgi:hypothetical protein
MPEIVRQRTRVVTIVRELISASMSEHVWVQREGKFCSAPCTLHHPQEPGCSDRSASLCGEHIEACALQWAQRS